MLLSINMTTHALSPPPHPFIDIYSAATHQVPPSILDLYFLHQLLFLSTWRPSACFQAKPVSVSCLPCAIRIPYTSPIPHCCVSHTSKAHPS